MKLALIAIALAACGYESSQLQLRTAVDTQQEPFHRCYAQALVNDPDMEGTLRVMIHVPARSEGKIDRVELAGQSQLTNPSLYQQLHRCVSRVLVGMPIGGSPVQDDLWVEYVFQFEPEGGPSTARVVNR